MCQLLALNCAQPTDFTFSFTGFSARGGLTDQHADGFGIAFFEQKACRLFIDSQSAVTSPVTQFIKRCPIKSKNIIAHIRKATQGDIQLENCHPFVRELWGKNWAFAHNGDLKNFHPHLKNHFQPIGNTDSEFAFCYLLESLCRRFGFCPPDAPELFDAVVEVASELVAFGVCNFVLGCQQFLIVHASTKLHYVLRQWPFAKAHLVDTDWEIDFSKHTTPDDRIAVIATLPLTDNEIWTAFKPGELMMFERGEIIHRAQLDISAEMQAEQAADLACV